ncbi:AAA family ATPase [Oceanibacterium hippocampi]|uniref:AAA family ATPase n=1 Tax=Oceanibacterium hippocampi TaxID=745714 RepID=UPI000A2700A8|nr:AAA family ATPase [Oceanibacterium hippocampi]
MQRYIVITGCSGGGKSTLLAELSRRGHAVVEEPGRRIVAEETRAGGVALPWLDMAAFARRAAEVALADRATVPAGPSPVFFDRGLIDAAAALEHATGEPAPVALGAAHRYHRRVFFTPPWPEIYRRDGERRHNLASAIAEYDRLIDAYAALGYEPVILPKLPVADRADFLLGALCR